MKVRHNIWLSISLVALTSSSLAGSFDRPSPLAPNNAPSSEMEEVFKMFHFFMPENGLPPHQQRMSPPLLPSAPAIFPQEFRNIDGTGNNLNNPTLGSANTPYLRTTTIAYGDGHGTPAGAAQKGAREISNLVCFHGPSPAPIALPESAYWWAWGQFIDHDMMLTPVASPTASPDPEAFPIPVPTCDPTFDPQCLGGQTIAFERSVYSPTPSPSPGGTPEGVREQLNANTHWLDGSMIYGSDDVRARALRALDGTGHLLTGPNNMLPFNSPSPSPPFPLPNEPNTDSTFLVSGDVRVNENPALTALTTLFVREHNFWADHFAASHPSPTPFSDDDLYNRARAIVGAEIQKITYSDFLPSLIGKDALTPYTGYNENVDPSIANVFGAAAWRFGHSLLNSTISRLDANNQSIGSQALQATFFQPSPLLTVGIEPYLRGLAHQKAEEIDGLIVDAVRNFFRPHGGGFDLAALNIQRGRDHGLPAFNQVRLDYGLPAYTSFDQLTSDPIMLQQLPLAYNTVDDVDAWVGLLVETHQANALVGPTLVAILKDQFIRLRDGDRFWYEAYLDQTSLAFVQHNSKLSDIILRNTTITTELEVNVFALQTPPPSPTPTPRPTRTPTPTPHPTRSPTPTPRPTRTPTPTPNPRGTQTPIPSPTPSAIPTP